MIDTQRLLQYIRASVDDVVKFPSDAARDLMIVYAALCWLARLRAIVELPYLHFCGEELSGKSIALETLAHLGGGTILQDYSAAAISAHLSEEYVTRREDGAGVIRTRSTCQLVCVDEIRLTLREVLGIWLAGVKAATGRTARKIGGRLVVSHSYCPKASSATEPFTDKHGPVARRVLNVEMLRGRGLGFIGGLRNDPNFWYEEIFDALGDELRKWAEENAEAVKSEIPRQYVRQDIDFGKFEGAWPPVLAVAKVLGVDLDEYCRVHLHQATESAKLSLRQAMLAIYEELDGDYSYRDLREKIAERFPRRAETFSSKAIGSMARDLGWDVRRRGSERFVRINRSFLGRAERLIHRFSGNGKPSGELVPRPNNAGLPSRRTGP